MEVWTSLHHVNNVAKKKTSKPKKKAAVPVKSAQRKPTRKATSGKKAATDPPASKRARVQKKSKAAASGLEDAGFPIVGIGASAGGLEALEQFFDAMPAGKAIAFIVVTHQHAGHVSLLPELLAKHTEMDICSIVEGEAIQPNRVYLAPSDGQLHLLDGKLQVLPTETGLHLPIDSFFRSLAIDQKGHAIGIVLSGTGTDGTLGIKSIKGESGMVMAQLPDSAKYDGMPRSAIATGVVDFVLPPRELAKQLLSYATGPYVAQAASPPVLADHGLLDVLPKIFVLLRNRTRHDFSHYKTNTIRRRVERRMSVHQIANPKDYLRFLQENTHELDVLFRELLIGVTSFFRDPEAFESLAEDVLPQLMETKPNGYVLRIWSAGCSTGEEAYSLAMLAQEVSERVNPELQFQVFATDLDERAIDVARRGVYPNGIAADVSQERLQRFFDQENEHYRIRKSLREHVIFAAQDVISDPPFSKLDLLSCRNVLIYMDGALQKRLLAAFHYGIRPGGLLFLGNSESIGDLSDAFAAIDKKWKIFRRRPEAAHGRSLTLRTPFELQRHHEISESRVESESNPQPVDLDLRHLLERRLLHSYAPPTVIASDRGEIVYIHGRTGAFLEPAEGEPTNNILTMARKGLQPALSNLMRKAAADSAEVVQKGIRVTNNGNSTSVDLIVRSISEPEMIRGLLMITFEETRKVAPEEAPSVTPKKKARGRSAQLEQELQYTKENLQSTIEELETANEELKSSNEELQSTNEELQSTNEELETSKEELQSLNEELQTVNAEFQGKMEDLALANDDMTNLLNNTSIATVFLGNDLKIKRFTHSVSDVIKMIPSDVGRPIGDLTSRLDYDLVTDAQDVLATLMTKETEVPAEGGRWYRVRLMPYRTSENVIDGLVATFVDVTASKEAEIQIAKVAEYTQSIVDTVREPLMVLDDELRLVSANEAFYRTFQVTPEDSIGQLLYELGDGQWNLPQLREHLDQTLQSDSAFEDFSVTSNFPSIGRRTMLLNGRRLEQAVTLPGKILLAIQDANGNNR